MGDVIPGLIQIQIVNYKRWDLTAACVASVLEQNCEDWRLLVIDNASPDDSVARLRERFPDLHILVSPENKGWGYAQNLGRRYEGFRGRAEFVFALNSDALLDPDCLGELRRALMADPGLGVVTPLIYKDKSRGKMDNVGYNLSYRYLLPLDWARVTRDHRKYLAQGWRMVSWTDDTAALMRIAAVEEAGGYDEDYFLYVDMTDLAYRITRKGWRLMVDYRAIAYHTGKGSSGDSLSAFSLRHKFRGWWMFQRKHFPIWHRPYTALWIVSMYLALGLKLCATGRTAMLRDLNRALLRGDGPAPAKA